MGVRAVPARGEVITVGSELLLAGATDGNAEWLRERLTEAGIVLAARSTVSDDEERIASIVDAACRRAEVVITTGGLGPTDDDRTRAAVARALGVGLAPDPARERALRERCSRLGLRFGPEQARQADRPERSQWIDNPLGSAAGFRTMHHGCLLAVLPGPPAEMRATFELGVAHELAALRGSAIASRVVRIAGVSEPEVDARVRDLYAWPGLEVTILSGPEGIVLHARAAAPAAVELADRFEAEVRRRLGHAVWGVGDERLPEVVGRALRAAGRTVAAAESCTGGLIGAALTAVPGSSAWFRGALIVYADDLKRDLAGVSGATLEAFGAVSRETASALARGAAERCGADIGLGVTGIAGPGGATAAKPIGLVHLALVDRETTLARDLRLSGDRAYVRARTVTAALDLLRRHLGGTLE